MATKKGDEFTVTQQPAMAIYGDYVDFGLCLISRNLNLLTVRGSGKLDQLALVSAPDKFDMEDNPDGTQRELDPKHAAECYDYASESVDLSSDEEPRAFPDVLLNIREQSAVEFYNPDDPGELYELSSNMSDAEIPNRVVGFRVALDRLDLPHSEVNPPISRFDGNHRLSGMDMHLRDVFQAGKPYADLDFPFIPFSLFVGLEPIQEKRLFNTVNEKHKGMEPALIDSQAYDLNKDALKSDPKRLPVWLARQLSFEGRAFEKMIFLGGSTKGLKEKDLKLPLRINTLRSAITLTVKKGGASLGKIVRDDPDLLLEILDNYWKAVREVFNIAWHDRKDHILLQSIGINGFALLAGKWVGDALEDDAKTFDFTFEEFRHRLQAVGEKVSLTREAWGKTAGAGGAQEVFDLLSGSVSAADANIARIKSKLKPLKTAEEHLTT